MRHFYHLYVDGPWQTPALDHLLACFDAGLPAAPEVVLVGRPRNRAAARTFLDDFQAPVVAEYDDGWEQRTLAILRERAGHADPAEPFLYCHSKGAGNPSGFQDAWRASMTRHVVDGWRRCTDILTSSDATGCHWLTPRRYPAHVTSPYFGGNFWWATAGYLASLPECSTGRRHDAERWLGLGNPRVFDLLPGWPCLPLFKIESATVPVTHN